MRRNTGENAEQSGGQPPRQQPGQSRQQPPAQQGPPQGGHPQQGGQQPQQPFQGRQQQPPQQRQQQQPPQQAQQPPRQQGPQGMGQQGQQGRGQSPPGGPQSGGMGPPQGMQGPSSAPPQPGTQGPPPAPGMQQGMGQQGMGQQGPSTVGGGPGGPQSMGRPGIAGPHLESVDIDDVIQTDVVTAEPDTPVTELAEMMASEDVGAVVVVDDEEPVGLVTDRKIALSIDEIENPDEVTAEEIATDETVTGTTTLTVFEVLDRMSDENIRRFPIVDDDGNLEGIITLDDLLVLLSTELEKAADIIQTQSPRL